MKLVRVDSSIKSESMRGASRPLEMCRPQVARISTRTAAAFSVSSAGCLSPCWRNAASNSGMKLPLLSHCKCVRCGSSSWLGIYLHTKDKGAKLLIT